jgi:hypothetical protein
MVYVDTNSRPPENPEYKTGLNSGRKQRQKDQKADTYPRDGLPISRINRSSKWISAYQTAYYQAKATGKPMMGNELRITISVSTDRELVDAIEVAGLTRSQCFEHGARSLLETVPTYNPKDLIF